jgi:hypothetical protein
MNRTQATLAGLLVIQAVLILLIRSPLSGSTGPVEATPLLPVLESFSPARMEISGVDDAKLTLVRDGESWSLEELDGFPADSEKIDKLLEDLAGLTVRRPVVTASRYHGKFKVAEDENEARLRMWDDTAGEPQVDLFVGSSSSYRAAHVRKSGEDPVYEVRGLSPYDLRPTANTWFARELVSIPRSEIVALVLDNANGRIELARVEGAWVARSPEGDLPLDPTKVDSLIGAVSSIQLAEPLGRATAGPDADSAAATLTLRFVPGGDPTAGADSPGTQEVTVFVGEKLPDKDTHRSVGRSDFEFTGSVWNSSVNRIVEEKLEDLRPSAAES